MLEIQLECLPGMLYWPSHLLLLGMLPGKAAAEMENYRTSGKG